jgi:hypothetical protein
MARWGRGRGLAGIAVALLAATSGHSARAASPGYVFGTNDASEAEFMQAAPPAVHYFDADTMSAAQFPATSVETQFIVFTATTGMLANGLLLGMDAVRVIALQSTTLIGTRLGVSIVVTGAAGNRFVRETAFDDHLVCVVPPDYLAQGRNVLQLNFFRVTGSQPNHGPRVVYPFMRAYWDQVRLVDVPREVAIRLGRDDGSSGEFSGDPSAATRTVLPWYDPKLISPTMRSEHALLLYVPVGPRSALRGLKVTLDPASVTSAAPFSLSLKDYYHNYGSAPYATGKVFQFYISPPRVGGIDGWLSVRTDGLPWNLPWYEIQWDAIRIEDAGVDVALGTVDGRSAEFASAPTSHVLNIDVQGASDFPATFESSGWSWHDLVFVSDARTARLGLTLTLRPAAITYYHKRGAQPARPAGTPMVDAMKRTQPPEIEVAVDNGSGYRVVGKIRLKEGAPGTIQIPGSYLAEGSCAVALTLLRPRALEARVSWDQVSIATSPDR